MNEKRVEAAIEYAAHFEHNRGFVSVAFLDGAEWALKNQWVSVEERLPKEKQEIVFAFTHHGCDKVFYRTHSFRFGFFNEFPANVTHWMPIPEPPK